MDVNLRPAFVLAKRLVPGMRERGVGRVVFVSSVAAFTGGVVGAPTRLRRPPSSALHAPWPAL